jgi:hypothetical protein
MGDMSRARGVRRACPVSSGPGWANSGTCSFLPGAYSFIAGAWERRGQPGSKPILAGSPRDGSAGHAQFSRQGVGILGICPRLGACGGHVPWDLTLAGPTGEHALSCRGKCSIFAARGGHMGDMSQTSGRAEGMSRGADPGRANPGACSFLPRDMLIHRGGVVDRGGTCSFIMPKPGHRGYMSGPWRVGRACPAVTRRRLLMPARGHRVLPTAEEGPQ